MTDDSPLADNATSRLSDRLDAIPTRWSLVALAHQIPTQDAITARNALVLRYSGAIRRYLGRFVGEAADDLAQEIMLRLLEGKFAGADPLRGRFRDYLKVSIRNLVRNQATHLHRECSNDLDLEPLARADEQAETEWLATWRKSILEHAFEALERSTVGRESPLAFRVIQLRMAHPDHTSEELAHCLEAETGQSIRADTLRQLLRRTRLKLAELLVDEVASGLARPTPEAVEEELAALGLLDYVRDFLTDDWKSRGILKPQAD